MTALKKPNISNDTILVFDKDGVIFHSEDFKFEYFLHLFDNYPEHTEGIKQYLVGSGGTPRKLRFEYIYQQVIGLKDCDKEVQALVDKSTAEMNPRVLETGFVEGFREFIAQYPDNKKFVCSGSPQKEVDQHLLKNAIVGQFESMHGGVKRKSEVLLDIKKNHGDDMVFFGDTMVDYTAAIEAKVPFVGLRTSKYHDPFRDIDICKVHSFNELLRCN